jgi:hypothetical protein
MQRTLAILAASCAILLIVSCGSVAPRLTQSEMTRHVQTDGKKTRSQLISELASFQGKCTFKVLFTCEHTIVRVDSSGLYISLNHEDFDESRPVGQQGRDLEIRFDYGVQTYMRTHVPSIGRQVGYEFFQNTPAFKYTQYFRASGTSTHDAVLRFVDDKESAILFYGLMESIFQSSR